ncbi:MAG: hypothetical protein K9G76_10285 [Bacteroidales bacterium]|nr:hypothetical protein [Bacteroidales bacterium]MCF8405225.1 hypothetical protein [Bacteroidales bacterium]
MKKIILTLILFQLINSCAKETSQTHSDYRDKFIGKYEFEIEHVSWWMTNDSIGWGSVSDSLHTIGRIEKYNEKQLLIKYYNEDISGLWIKFDSSCDIASICSIDDTSNLPEMPDDMIFWGYYENWTAPLLLDNSILKIQCVTFDSVRGGLHETFGGYFISNDSIYFGYSSGGLGAGSFTEIYGKKVKN